MKKILCGFFVMSSASFINAGSDFCFFCLDKISDGQFPEFKNNELQGTFGEGNIPSDSTRGSVCKTIEDYFAKNSIDDSDLDMKTKIIDQIANKRGCKYEEVSSLNNITDDEFNAACKKALNDHTSSDSMSGGESTKAGDTGYSERAGEHPLEETTTV